MELKKAQPVMRVPLVETTAGIGTVWRPRLEDQQLEVAWAGDSWRKDPPPRQPDARDLYLANDWRARPTLSRKRNRAETLAQLTRTQRKAYKLLTGQWRSVRDLALALDIERSTVQKPLTALLSLGLIERKALPTVGVYRGRQAYEYRALAADDYPEYDESEGGNDVE